jgi:TonB-linked SusC/RagA family outer membrane protein
MKIKYTNNDFLNGNSFMLFIMKTFIFLFCTTVFSFSPGKIFSQSAKITISADKTVTVDEVFEMIRKQTKYTFIYEDGLFNNIPKINLTKGVIDANILLEKSLSHGNFEVIVSANNAILIREKEIKAGDPIIIKGTVKDNVGNPLPAVNVYIKGTKTGVYTDFDGSYTIRLSNPNSVLVFSYIGFKTKEIAVGNYSTIDLMMEVDSYNLQEVVLSTGYQTVSKERATGSYSAANMQVFESRRGTQNVVSRLEGTVAGLTVLAGPKGTGGSRNGSGSKNQKSVIRGLSSIQLATDPIYAVDGVLVNDFSIVNPDDIEDITVLKDAAAAAIWGAKASNGVIVVTTKRGKKNEKISINYNAYFNFDGKPDFGYGKMMSSSQYIQAAKETFNPTVYPWGSLSRQFVAPHEVILYDQYRGLISQADADQKLNTLAATDNRSQVSDLWYRDAYSMGHTLSLSGGTSAYSFYTSVNYIDSQSNRPGSDSRTYRIAINQDYDFSKNFKVFLNFSLNNSLASDNKQIGILNASLPYQLFRDEQGNSINMPYMLGWSEATRLDFQARSRINLDYRPLDEINYGYTKTNDLGFDLTTGFNLNLYKGLSFKGTYGYIRTNGNSKVYEDAKSLALRLQLLSLTVAPTLASTPVYYLPTTGGTYSTGNTEQVNWTVRNQLIYTKNFREDKDRLDLQFGQEANEQLGSGSTTRILGYNVALGTYPQINYVALANGVFGTVPSFRGSYTAAPYTPILEKPSRVSSYFALGSYMFNHKYGIDASWRVDHSNLFGSDNSAQNKPVWSIGGKWFIGKENFMKNMDWMSNLAIRGTYGITGNSPYVGASSNADILYSSSSADLAGPSLGFTALANTKLAWESTQTINLGLDFTLFHNAITGSIDAYDKNTTDMLGRVPLNPFTGANTGLGNIGSLKNQGIELTLRTVNLQAQDFNWTTNFVFSYNKNKLESYSTSNATTAQEVLALNFRSGYSMQPLFAYDFVGLDNLGDPMIKLADGTITKDPYAVKPEDLKYMGTIQPVFNGGLTNTFTYKGISLTANMVYSMGNVMRNDVNTFYSGRMTAAGAFDGNINQSFANRWQNPGDEANTNIPSYVPQPFINFDRRNTDYYTKGDINVSDASFIKMRDITLRYSFSDKVLQSMHLAAFSLNLQMSNFMLWKANHADIDPEYANFQGVRLIPQTKHPVNLSLNISL